MTGAGSNSTNCRVGVFAALLEIIRAEKGQISPWAPRQ